MKDDAKKQNKSRNPDPITGAPGSHPIGTGLGAAAGGAATGAAIGTTTGPVGTAVGAAVGAIVGGLAGKGIAETVNPTAEEAYWREHHEQQDYAQGRPYDDFGPAYSAGFLGYSQYGAKGQTFEETEPELRRRYESSNPKLPWTEARPASRAAWNRFDQQNKSPDPTGIRRPV